MSDMPRPSAPKVPQSQQEAQDTVFGYLQRTVDALPAGTKLDSTDFRGGGNFNCDDEPAQPGTSPVAYDYWTHAIVPPGVSADDLVEAAGKAWQSWGMRVLERDEFRKPNRFGYPADGYSLQIKGPSKPGYPPTVIVSSPCFPAEHARDGLPAPTIFTQGR
ncbi:hypothetical protein MINS_26270 [Mycolicibacterium insubricum]|jgi:hypothetical protein|uniref:Uncharacterized protein n=1 Tax=Mycolicibacterium insubricum TaxID=444597 RepID=A0A1X0DCB4_9MYCO|nr:hypothetical protein [Mycolicibacterium insubricum]MCV7081216.1 hypothetical protein [Mycolicibacterium insubricum]ORA69812.1 hypothetical protein BST26_12545 [Mycolicibacterium insubricum]BBZ67198.1 hypothetical protein MINS_26270 [Mycolicibacterium insubricum]